MKGFRYVGTFCYNSILSDMQFWIDKNKVI